jgi:hypothetical protein
MSRWDAKEPLDLNPWSLLPSVGLTKHAALWAQVIWALFIVVCAIIRSAPALVVMGILFVSGWHLWYITNRLGGRVGVLLGVGGRVSPDSSFQWRLVGDLLSLFICGASALFVISGGNIKDLWQ